MSAVRIKFCGITSAKDADRAILSGADAIGFVFFKDSPRYIEVSDAENIIKGIPPFIVSVGVFVNEDLCFIEECVFRCGLSAVQLHGDEDVRYCLNFRRSLAFKSVKLIRAVRLKGRQGLRSIEGYPVDAILLDTYRNDVFGGTGKGFDRTLAILSKEYNRRIIVSGGLNPNNVYEVIKEVMPYAVDVSSGIESSPGKKNMELMEQFVKEVRRAERETKDL